MYSFGRSCSHKYHIWIISFPVNWFKMQLQATLSGTALFTNVTFEWFLFLMNWFNTYIHITFLRGAVECRHKCHIWIVFFSHELIHHVFSHKSCIGMVSFFHDLIQHVYPHFVLWNSCRHKFHIWTAFFLIDWFNMFWISWIKINGKYLQM